MRNESVYRLVLLALLAALVVLLGLTPLGLIPLGFINVTILCVPVLVGTMTLGLSSGLVLGLCFGAVSAATAFTRPSALVATLLAASPVLTLLMSLLPRLAVPAVAWGVGRLLDRPSRQKLRLPAAAVAGSLTNTVLYLGLMLLFYVLTGLDAASVLTLIAGIGLIAGGCEAVVAAILVTPITLALQKVQRA